MYAALVTMTTSYWYVTGATIRYAILLVVVWIKYLRQNGFAFFAKLSLIDRIASLKRSEGGDDEEIRQERRSEGEGQREEGRERREDIEGIEIGIILMKTKKNKRVRMKH